MAPHHPNNHPYVITCGTGEKAGNSARQPLKRAPAELPCMTIDWWRILYMRYHAFSRYTVINISKQDLIISIAKQYHTTR